MKKSILTTMMLLVFFVTSCGAAETQSGTGSVKWSNISAASDINFSDPKLSYMGINGDEDWLQEVLGRFEAMGGQPDFITTVWEQRHQQLATKVATQDSPDIYKYEIGSGDWPTLIFTNQVQSVDDMIDYNSPLFSHLLPIYNRMKIGGKGYLLPVAVGPFRSVLIYNKKMFDDYGVETPYELYKKNQWTMAKMEEYAKKFTSIVDGNVQTLGMYVPDEGPFIGATGRDIFGRDSEGKIYNNIKDPLIAKAMERVQRMFNDDKSLITDYNMARDLMVKGKMAMWAGPFWSLDTLKILTSAGALEFVPFPKDPEADKWYLDGLIDAVCIPKGAKNTDAALAWVATQTEYNKDPAKIKKEEAETASKYNMSTEFGPLFTSMRNSDKFELNFLMYRDFDDFYQKFFTEFWDNLMKGQSWSSIVERLSPAVDEEIKKLETLY